VGFDIELRSPALLYSFLGRVLRHPEINEVGYRTKEARELTAAGEPFLNVVRGKTDGCAVYVLYLSQSYCVPISGSANTLVMMQILQALRNLSISPTDLNVPFSVHITD